MKFEEEYLYSLKDLFSKLYGSKEWYKFKHCYSLKNWKNEILKIIKTIKGSIDSFITNHDDDFKKEILYFIDSYKDKIENSDYKDIENLLSDLSTFSINIIFRLIGHMPNHYKGKSVKNTPQHWDLNKYRSVIYSQTDEQRMNLINSQLQKKGFDIHEINDLKQKYHEENINITFQNWLIKNNYLP